MKKALVLGVVAVFAAVCVGADEIVVLKGGKSLTLARPYVVKGKQAVMTLKDGTVISVAAVEIDRGATAAARRAATAPAAPSAPASEPSPAEAARSQKGAPRASVRIGDEDVAHYYTGPGAGEETDGAQGDDEGGARVDVANWDQTFKDGSVTLTGTLRNSGTDVARDVGVIVSGKDDQGKTLGSTSAEVTSPSLEPGATASFTAVIPSPARFESVRFQPRWKVARPANKPGAEPPKEPETPSAKPAAAPGPGPEKSPEPKYVPQADIAPPPANAPTKPSADGRTGFLPDYVPVPPPPPPPQ